MASSPAAPRSLRLRRIPFILGKLRGNERTSKKEALGGWEGTRSCGDPGPVGVSLACSSEIHGGFDVCEKGSGVVLGFFHWTHTYTHSRRAGQGCGRASFKHTPPALASLSAPRRRNKELQPNPSHTAQELQLWGPLQAVRLRRPQSREGSLPLCGRSALLHTSKPVKWLCDTDLCVPGGPEEMCARGGWREVSKTWQNYMYLEVNQLFER